MSTTTITILVLVGSAQVVLLVAALVTWARTPRSRLTMNRWGWLAVIVCLSVVGPLAFLAAGRGPAPVAQTRSAGARASVRDAVSDLYEDAAR